MRNQEKIFVIGHKNPDTDSICSAIAYADIKNRTSQKVKYIPKRAGQINEETEYVLNRFGMQPPGYLSNIGTQIKDMDIRMSPEADKSMSLKNAWDLMMEKSIVSLPIRDREGQLEGLITIGDIAKTYMDTTDSYLLSRAKTQYRRIAETIAGTVVEGNEHGYFTKGKVLVGTANPEMLKAYIEPDDLIIMGDREEDHLQAIAQNVSCIIVGMGIEVFKHLNTVVLGRNHGTVMIAEESTAWPMVTGDAEKDGLGFSLKWNMGWMNDFLEYMKLDPYFRKFNHNKMTFSMSYAYSERYVLVLSHDEVVHLKCSMLEKMPGELPDKFRNLKAAYSFMNCHPGKKLLFMGQEFGQLREWSEERELDWFLLNEEPHKELQNYVHDLLTIYKKYPALYAGDNNPEGFEWINADDGDRSIFSFVRKSPTKRNNILYIVNFTPVDRPDYRVGVPKKKQYKLIMDENGLLEQPKTFKAVKQECDNREFSFAYPLPAYGVAIFTY